MAWLGAFLFGQALETPLYALGPLRDRPLPAALLLGFGATALTHPFVWFVFPRLLPEPPCPYWLMAALAEAFAVGAEALYLAALGGRRPLLSALLANGLSCGLGLLSRAQLGWP